MRGVAVLLGLLASCGHAPEAPVADRARNNTNETKSATIDDTWAGEEQAQRHEAVFTRWWDALIASRHSIDAFSQLSFRGIRLGSVKEQESLELNITRHQLATDVRWRSRLEWIERLRGWAGAGVRVVQSEWHHASFTPKTSSIPAASSRFRFAIDALRLAPAARYSLRGEIKVTWAETSNEPDESNIDQYYAPRIATIELIKGTLLERPGSPAFREALRLSSSASHPRILPLLIVDLDDDGQTELIAGGLNKVVHQALGAAEQSSLFPQPLEMYDAALVADFDGDQQTDLLFVGVDRKLQLARGGAQRQFAMPQTCADVSFENPKAFTAGDVDLDGDLDVWIGQYKFPYEDGTRPTPFYDANDGHPGYLLLNNGKGQFHDATEAAGISEFRNRRTYSSSLVDLDDDGQLDLLTVNDFAGVDAYRNSHGKFVDVTQSWLEQRRMFGMAHTFIDFDLDGLLDVYLIGMSSTTATRLDRLKLGKSLSEANYRMRPIMAYGNRLLLRTNEPQVRFRQFAKRSIAQTGWSWGVTSSDFDNDGDEDLYVANGHLSGRSTRDYCSTFWRHDIYAGDVNAGADGGQSALDGLYAGQLQQLREGLISWNGFEHNVLWMNHAAQGKSDATNIAFLLGVGLEADGRAVASEDFDRDGQTDLVVVNYHVDTNGETRYELVVFRNELTTKNHWIGVSLDESIVGRSPIGARVTLQLPDGTQQIRRVVTGDSFSTQQSSTLHFGLGASDRVQTIEVRWLDGASLVLQSPGIDRYHEIRPQDVNQAQGH